MASSSSTQFPVQGYDCDFVDPPEELQSDCPICLQILREPQLTSCCGHHFCRDCIMAVLRLKKPCPLCNAEEFDTLLNKALQRSLKQLDVRCRCTWTGQLRTYEDHRRLQCELTQIDCKFCMESFQRGCLSSHEATCPKRMVTCEYCDYGPCPCVELQTHWTVCKHFPVQCPNQCCEDKMSRMAVEHHVENRCPVTITMRLSSYPHSMQPRITSKDLFPCPDCAAPIQFVPLTLRMERFSVYERKREPWTSKPFYTAPVGYMFEIIVDPGKTQGYISVRVRMTKHGVFDRYLVFPFHGKIKMRVNGTHTLTFNYSCDKLLSGMDRQESGRPRYLSRSAIQPSCTDSLSFHVEEVQVL